MRPMSCSSGERGRASNHTVPQNCTGGKESGCGTERANRATFEREDGATWGGGCGWDRMAQRGAARHAARHAGQSAEFLLARCGGLMRRSAELLASRSPPMSPTRAEETTANRCAVDHQVRARMAGVLGVSPGKGSCRQQGTRDWGRGSTNEGIGRSSGPRRRGGPLKGGLDFSCRVCHEAHGPAMARPTTAACRCSGAGWVGRFVFHAIAVSFDYQGLPMMHQPIDQGRGQSVVRVTQGAPFPERSIRGQHDRSGFITGSTPGTTGRPRVQSDAKPLIARDA